jgi:hypothetical protein
MREAVCFDVELLNLVLPNAFLNVSNGSRAVFYPYVYVELTPISNSERYGPNSINSNNPNARRMLFRAIVKDVVNDVTSPFVRIDGSGMKQRVKLGLALYSDVPLVLLDEPTTNLDVDGADWYLDGINSLPKNTLLIVASNTPSDYESFDHKLFIKDYKKKFKA